MEKLRALWRAERRAARAKTRPRRMRIYSFATGAGALVCAVLMAVALAEGRPGGAGIYFTVGGLLALLAVFARLRAGGKNAQKEE